ncbi:MAG: HEAT repeat domain-containing protein, partial [Myxococcota bacterium]
MSAIEFVAPAAFVRDLNRALSLLDKAARARRIYHPGNQAFRRMMRDLHQGLEPLVNKVDTLELRIRPSGVYYEDGCVLEAPNPDDSLAFAFYRDGIRRIAFHRGLPPAELEVFVAAAASGFKFSGLGEDTVTFLWRHDLEHIQYLVVDTTITDATEAPPEAASDHQRPPSAAELDDAIDGLLRSIYGETQDDVGVTSFSLDRSDFAAKQIAESLDRIDDMAPGFHPLRRFTVDPAYAREILAELEREDEHRVALRAAHAVLRAVGPQQVGSTEARRLFEVLLKMYDAAIIDESLRLAGYILGGVLRTAESPERTAWLREALAEARLRQVASNVAAASDPDMPGLVAFFRACGPAASRTVLSVLSSFKAPENRRALSDVVLELGVPDTQRLRELLQGDREMMAREAMYILTRSRSPEARKVLAEAEHHPAAEVRTTLLENAHLLGSLEALELAERLLDDPDPRVQVAAAGALARFPGRASAQLFEARVLSEDLDAEPPEVKGALLAGYATVSQSRALPIFARLVKRGEGLFTSRRTEDSAVQAIRHLPLVRGAPRMLDILKKAAISRNRRIRETARE